MSNPWSRSLLARWCLNLEESVRVRRGHAVNIGPVFQDIGYLIFDSQMALLDGDTKEDAGKKKEKTMRESYVLHIKQYGLGRKEFAIEKESVRN